ncbi:DsbA family oxidoreductase [Streptomyces spongiae]|uniref:DsbA family oxidoreductase n=1 Tax=Streptomyces spongiae TaxID=565072 RepID=A0A5N8XN84_9ACTN|nr:DsbA family oxidoreductase [Streptomyces spongiae]MPY60940.1 DsbA family oxidoreductase [Streptomyces spongiae]
MTSPRLTIDMWADVLCPWCYVGERRLSAAVARSPHAADIELRIHTWQLDPNVPTQVTWIPEYRVAKFGVTPAQARAMENGVAGEAAADGLPYVLDRPVRNTLDMLRLVHLGNEHGVGLQYMSAMHAELFGGNPDTFEHDTLIRLGEELGIPADEIRDVLATDRYADAVQADHDAAVTLGARGVPFTVLGERLGIPGTASARQYTDAINQAWEQING